MSSMYDIVVVGAGPVGLMLAVCLARWGYRVKILDDRAQPTVTGRADGIQPRSLHLLRNMGLKRSLMALDPAKFYETMFWDPLANGEGIHRTGVSPSCPSYIQARYPFSTLVHQGLIEKIFIDDLKKTDTPVQRPWTITDFSVDENLEDYPVTVKLKHLHRGVQEVVQAKYLFSAEGARSSIRKKLGLQLIRKDPVSHIWGVIDGVVQTDFPDIRTKSNIHSDSGSMMILPREDNMVRLYIQLDSSDDADFEPRRNATAEEVQAAAKKILRPYHIEWDEVRWYSVYPIAQSIAERYTLDHRVFLGGDCCHTHSPKAGQGMNTAFHDALNLSWKIHLVEAGMAHRSLLETYESERKAIAEELLDFDAQYAALFSQQLSNGASNKSAASSASSSSSPGPTTDSSNPKTSTSDNESTTSTEESENAFVQLFKSRQEFTTGYGIVYGPNVLTPSALSHPHHPLFLFPSTALQAGRVMPPVNVTRVTDGNPVQLEQAPPFNGGFRLFLFAGALTPTPANPSSTRNLLSTFCATLARRGSFYSTYAHPPNTLARMSPHELHTPHSAFFTIATIFISPRIAINIPDVCPPLLAQYRHHIYADDQPDPCPVHPGPSSSSSNTTNHTPGTIELAQAHKKMGFSSSPSSTSLPSSGVIVVRPDGHVGCVVRLVEGEGTVDALDTYFNGFASRPLGALARQGLSARL